MQEVCKMHFANLMFLMNVINSFCKKRHHGIMYRLVSGDYLNWVPLQIL